VAVAVITRRAPVVGSASDGEREDGTRLRNDAAFIRSASGLRAGAHMQSRVTDLVLSLDGALRGEP
jgi:hypothetical protein